MSVDVKVNWSALPGTKIIPTYKKDVTRRSVQDVKNNRESCLIQLVDRLILSPLLILRGELIRGKINRSDRYSLNGMLLVTHGHRK